MRSAGASASCLVTVLLGLTMVEGCSTFNPNNVAGRPWNRPPKWALEDDWLLHPYAFDSGRKPGDTRPGALYP
jgi:hypothetical protein